MQNDDELELFNKWKENPSPATSQALINGLQKYIIHAIAAAGGDTSNPVIRAKANMMALQCMPRYNPKTSTLQNFLYSQLRGLHRVLGTENNIIQMPESVVLGRKLINEADKELTDSLGRAPSAYEIADYTGMPVKRIKKLLEVNLPIAEGTVDAAAEEGLEGTRTVSSSIIGENKSQDAWNEYVYDALSDRQRSVMERLYGMHGYKPQTPEQISKALKISRAAVSQHKKAIDKELNSDSRYTLFGD